MANPFNTRATEFVKSNEAFLTLVSAEPITHFLAPYGKEQGLFNKLVSIQGQPGCGKTTISRLFEFSTLSSLLRAADKEAMKELVSPLQKCEVLKSGSIQILGCRIPLESDFREVWQLPYEESIRLELFDRLLQARTVLAWFGHLQRAGCSLEQVKPAYRSDSHAVHTFVGGAYATELVDRAKAVESAVYRLVGSLTPPPTDKIDSILHDPYPVFDSLESIILTPTEAARINAAESLRPLVILDDAHFLHPSQLEHLRRSLLRRELLIGRWIMSRLDVLEPQELFDELAQEVDDEAIPGVTINRDAVRISLQGTSRGSRRKFSTMAKHMSQKALRHIRIFDQNRITTFETFMPVKPGTIGTAKAAKLEATVRETAERLKVSKIRFAEFQQLAADFLRDKDDRKEIHWAIVSILIHRYAKRTPQVELFAEDDPIPSTPISVDLSVYDGARVHLLHGLGAPYYYGFEALSDAASDNAEVFLNICSHIVEAAENLLIKQRTPILSPADQHKLIVSRANRIVSDWNFPEVQRVRRLCDFIAARCLRRSLEPNAPLGPGANAYGISQASFEEIPKAHPIFANALKFAVAYNGLSCHPNYDCKNRKWCLFELGGPFVVTAGLTFKKGGFVEGTVKELLTAIDLK